MASPSTPHLLSVAPFYRNDHNNCTAWSLRSTGLWVTAVHCLHPRVMEFDEDDITPAPVVYRIQDQVATIKVEFPADDLAVMETPLGARPLKIAKHALRMGDPVQLLGYPLGREAVLYSEGIVANPAYPNDEAGGRVMSWFALPVCQGSSGTAIVNKHNEVVSVFQQITGRPCAPFASGVTWSDLMRDVAGFSDAR